ncbi:hypothetical protein FGO68_gene1820 [Halteria grandinella]|uniref:Uncharacterized protein n=1 Tax=Halteria grandinella TaxID=5974 RepID=A0A8J8NI80_HALGN|nr:hypothetical protein FGO68_gene1820 [Halteria grandinella]
MSISHSSRLFYSQVTHLQIIFSYNQLLIYLKFKMLQQLTHSASRNLQFKEQHLSLNEPLNDLKPTLTLDNPMKPTANKSSFMFTQRLVQAAKNHNSFHSGNVRASQEVQHCAQCENERKVSLVHEEALAQAVAGASELYEQYERLLRLRAQLIQYN